MEQRSKALREKIENVWASESTLPWEQRLRRAIHAWKEAREESSSVAVLSPKAILARDELYETEVELWIRALPRAASFKDSLNTFERMQRYMRDTELPGLYNPIDNFG